MLGWVVFVVMVFWVVLFGFGLVGVRVVGRMGLVRLGFDFLEILLVQVLGVLVRLGPPRHRMQCEHSREEQRESDSRQFN